MHIIWILPNDILKASESNNLCRVWQLLHFHSNFSDKPHYSLLFGCRSTPLWVIFWSYVSAFSYSSMSVASWLLKTYNNFFPESEYIIRNTIGCNILCYKHPIHPLHCVRANFIIFFYSSMSIVVWPLQKWHGISSRIEWL